MLCFYRYPKSLRYFTLARLGFSPPFLHAGICFHNGTSWLVNFRPGRKHNALSMEFCFLPVGRGKWKTAGRCPPEDSYVQTSRPFNISYDVIGGMRRRPITLSLDQFLIFSFFFHRFAVEYSGNVYKYVCRSPYTVPISRLARLHV